MIESRLGADIYKEQSMIDEFNLGSGDIHSLCAYKIYEDIIPRDTKIKDIKHLYPNERKEVKGVEFSQQFGGSAEAIQSSLGCSKEKALKFRDAYAKAFPGIQKFKYYAAMFVKNQGYILLCPITGHRTYWPEFSSWKSIDDDLAMLGRDRSTVYSRDIISKHYQTGSKYERKSLNSPTQGTGAVILKHSQIKLFKWVVKNGYFGKCLLVNLTHDECNWEFPETLKEFPDIVKECMESIASIYCKSVKIPAEVSVGNHWIH